MQLFVCEGDSVRFFIDYLVFLSNCKCYKGKEIWVQRYRVRIVFNNKVNQIKWKKVDNIGEYLSSGIKIVIIDRVKKVKR